MQTITRSTRPPTEEQIGQLAFNREEDEVYVCTKCYGYPTWSPLAGLSSANWMRHRDEIADAMAEDKKDSIKKETKNKANVKYMEEGKTTEVMLVELYEKLSPEEKKTFLNSHKKSWLLCSCEAQGLREAQSPNKNPKLTINIHMAPKQKQKSNQII